MAPSPSSFSFSWTEQTIHGTFSTGGRGVATSSDTYEEGSKEINSAARADRVDCMKAGVGTYLPSADGFNFFV
jgi:hypothetical protein